MTGLDAEPWMAHALNRIWVDYGVRAYTVDKSKDLLKFGRTEQAGTGTYATVMTLPTGTLNETYVASNLITKIVSTSTADLEEVKVEGHTIVGTTLTFVVQTISLTGQTIATLATPLARVSRVYNNDSTELAGTISVFETDTATAGVPATAAKVHLQIRAGQQQSEKCSTSISDQDFWIITSVLLDVLEKTAAFVDGVLELRLAGKVFRPLAVLSASSGQPREIYFEPYLIAPPNSDIRMSALSSAGTTTVSGKIQGVLAIIRPN